MKIKKFQEKLLVATIVYSACTLLTALFVTLYKLHLSEDAMFTVLKHSIMVMVTLWVTVGVLGFLIPEDAVGSKNLTKKKW